MKNRIVIIEGIQYMTKIYRNKYTKELFSMPFPNELCSLFDDRHIFVLNADIERHYEEINVAPVDKNKITRILFKEFISAYTDFNTIQDRLNSDSDLDTLFGIGDTYYIPAQGYENPISFEVVHINDEERSLYLMPRDILARMPMSEVEAWLKDFKSKLPWDLVEHLKPIEHINSTGTHRSLISLPSIRNMGKDVDYCTGKDDVMFDKFKDEASRCKKFEGETQWYWTDTSHISISAGFWFVYGYGGYGIGNASYSGGVCPIIKLSEDR